jgi:hypothetical protein
VTPGDLEAAYADAVRHERGSVHLLRLTQKTGPVWGQLSTQTCHALLEVFIKHVRVSRALGAFAYTTVGPGLTQFEPVSRAVLLVAATPF